MSRRKEPAIPNELLDQLLAGGAASAAFEQGGLLDSLKKALTERALNAEMDHPLAGDDGAGNTRNGYGRKTVLTETGKLAIDVPRDRQASFDPQLIAKYQRRFPGFDDKIVSMYARGMSTREITGHLHDLYGIDVSPDLISTVTDAVLDEIATWQQRPLDPVYPLVFFDAIRVKIRDEGMVRNKVNRPLRCYVSKSAWLGELQSIILDIELGVAPFTAIVVVNRTLKSPEFQQLIARVPGQQLLWIGDECHHHGSEAFKDALPKQAKYRLGLSATPEHYLDATRNARLEDYYGKVVFTYSLAQAIQNEVLTPYDYFPHVVELTTAEADEFVALSVEIGRMTAREGGGEPSLGLKALMMKRSRVIASARNKIPSLRTVLRDREPEPHTLFYCGDGYVDADDDDDARDDDDPGFSGRQIEVVSEHLDELGWTLSRFTSREPRKERDHILANFRIGLVDAMVAIKCLDEGIDVPACRTAYILASSRDPRQFIQRRGRILRRSAGKDVATIHDFVVVLPTGAGDEEGFARKLITSELRRVAEFAGLSRNRAHAYQILRSVLVAYGLEHLL